MGLFINLIKEGIGYNKPTQFKNVPDLTEIQISKGQENLERVMGLNKDIDVTEGMTSEEIQAKGQQFISEISKNK